MKKKDTKPDWSDPCWRDMLVYQRKMAWFEDTLDKLAKWMGLIPGMTAVDVGCGLGYLGYTYWPYFGKGGRYVGIDANRTLIGQARAASHNWAEGGEAHFIAGDAYRLPLSDNSCDWAMCQVVLIHLEHPRRALEEMMRVLKPGGLIMCKEPDNMSSAMVQHVNSTRQLSIAEKLLSLKVILTGNQGRIARGDGDNSLGPKIPHMLAEMGMTQIDIRLNDKVHHVEPPYDTPAQQTRLEMLTKQLLNPERRRTLIAREEEEFLAGGGSPEEYARIRTISDELLAEFKRQLDAGTYYACGGGLFYVIIGRKPV